MVLANFPCLIQRCQLLEIKCGWNTKSARQQVSHSWGESPDTFCYLDQVLHLKVIFRNPTQEWNDSCHGSSFLISTLLTTSVHALISLFNSCYTTAKQVSSRFRKTSSNQYSADVHIAYYDCLVWDP